MIESLVITLREGVEAALVVGIILAYLNKTGKTSLNRMVYLGLGAAVIASIAFAMLFQALKLNPENEYLEGTLLGIAGILVASLVVWMWRVAKSIRENVERKLDVISSRGNLRAQGVGLLGFTFLMVFREGAETVLFLMGATLGRFELLSFIGGAIGLGLAVLFAIFFIRGSLRMNLSRFFAVTSIVLLVLALKLVLGSLHEFGEVGAIPLTPGIMSFVGFFVRENTSTVLLMVLLMAPLLVILWDVRSRGVVSLMKGESSVEKRKHLALRRQERAWRLSLVIASIFIMFAMGWVLLAANSFTDPEPIPVAPVGGEIRIPVAELAEGKLAKYVYDTGGTGVRFLIVRYPDGAISTALDACQICGPSGYGQEGETAICKRCNAPIALDTIGQGGGCNPLPLAAGLASDIVVVSVDELIQAKPIFE
ncbi:MAG: Fe-S-containing protein [Actinobacteria bacterium]|nr:Fe-S-containing protein [Actinomycetota bacterium]